MRDPRDFKNIETRAVIKVFFLQGKAPKEIHVILTGTLACFLPGRAKDLSARLYKQVECKHGSDTGAQYCRRYCSELDKTEINGQDTRSHLAHAHCIDKSLGFDG